MIAPAALVLAAGLGTRLRPLTWVRAKPAVPVGNEPLISRILRWLAAAGIRDVILNLHYRPETITRIVGDGSAFGLRVRYSWEDPILGSAGGPRRAFSLIPDDELLVVNGDTVTDVDLASLIAAHRAARPLVTLALTPNPDPARYGGVRLDSSGAYVGTTARGDANTGWHFPGVQMVERGAFADLAPDVPAQSIGGHYDHLVARAPGSVRGWTTEASFVDVGTPATYLAACLALGPDVRPGRGCRIAPGSELSRAVLWDDVTIERDVSLTECIVADGVIVPSGSRYHRAVLLRRGDAPLGPGDRVDGNLQVTPITD
ncbi:MAG TPA: NDP-sugar synthase [Vicinamibacterales bacterium]|nr:NDP-sugar synthase [Vicinamibacterales bacterium]